MQKYSRQEAIERCIKLIDPRKLEMEEYNILKAYKERYKEGTLGEKGILTLFKRFNVNQHCFYTFD